jgi:putative endonuclease
MQEYIRKEYCVYMLKCSDGSYYTGVTSNLEERMMKHVNGWDPKSYTYSRRPVELVYTDSCDDVNQAIAWEKQIQGWSRKKKEALIKEDWDKMHALAMNRKNREQRASTHPSTSED